VNPPKLSDGDPSKVRSLSDPSLLSKTRPDQQPVAWNCLNGSMQWGVGAGIKFRFRFKGRGTCEEVRVRP